MTACRCAKCRRRELYQATGMTLSLAWNKKLNETCTVSKNADFTNHQRQTDSAPGKTPTVKEAS